MWVYSYSRNNHKCSCFILEQDMAACVVEDMDRDSVEEVVVEASDCFDCYGCSYDSNCVVCCFVPSSSACTLHFDYADPQKFEYTRNVFDG